MARIIPIDSGPCPSRVSRGENAESGYQRILRELTAEFEPRTTTESFLVQQVARAQWKLERLVAQEDSLSRTARVTTDVLLLNQYEAAVRSAYQQALNQLLALRGAPPAHEAGPGLAREGVHDSEPEEAS